MAALLPYPRMDAQDCASIRILTDETLFAKFGVRIAFTSKKGGVSKPPFEALNLASHVGDDLDAVLENRRILLEALGLPHVSLLNPNQVHGTEIVRVEAADRESLGRAASAIAAGADGIVVECADVAALLCFADCLPVIVVSPSGRFAVAHAGWRGAVAGIAGKAVALLAEADAADAVAEYVPSQYNAYIGPYIHSECFETGADVAQRFSEAFGNEALRDSRHVDLGRAVAIDLVRAGVDEQRIADAGMCTRCHPDEYYSYRATGGLCGRHGAFCVKTKR